MRVVAKPSAQSRAGGDIAEPQVEGCLLLGQAAGPQPIDEHADAIGCGWCLVDPLEFEYWVVRRRARQALNPPQDPQACYQHDRTNRGYHEAAEEPAAHGYSCNPEQETAEQGADNPDDQVANDAIAARPHDPLGKPSGSQPDQDEPHGVHWKTGSHASKPRKEK